MTTIAFIGLGIMGGPMAVNLVRAGYDVTGYNRTPDKARPLTEAGGRAAPTVAEAVDGADMVATMVSDTPDVREVLTGDGGVFARAKQGALLVDFSTIRPDVAIELGDAAARRGLRLLDAPVSGGDAGARDATLSIMAGGADADFAAAKPVFDTVGRTVVHVGPAGSGQTVKAANQLVVGAHIQALSEAVVFLESYGVDTTAALEVLGGGMAGSRILDAKKDNMLSRSFEPGFRVDLHHKDMGIATSAARESGVTTPVGALVAQLMASANAVGDGAADHSALLRGVERLSGRDRPDADES